LEEAPAVREERARANFDDLSRIQSLANYDSHRASQPVVVLNLLKNAQARSERSGPIASRSWISIA
jgi:hypothetical protein